MAVSLRHLKNRIRSIQNVKKVTGAMELISVTKLNRIDDSLYAVRPYFTALDELLQGLLKGVDRTLSPYLSNPKTAQREKVLCLITSDNGLCGLYNHNIIKKAEEFIENHRESGTELIVVGKSGFNYFKRTAHKISASFLGLNGRYSQKTAQEITDTLTKLFLSGQASEIFVLYTHYQNGLIYRPTLRKFLSLLQPAGKPMEYLFEPSQDRIIEELIPRYISIAMKLMLIESFTSEHAARAVAMKTATDNAKELLENLVLLRNKVRQAGITQDIMEIISSAEALKG